MLITLHPKDPQARLIKQIADCLRSGGVIIYPTDTVYGLGCDIFQPKAVERICRIKGLDPLKANLSFICSDLSDLSKYARTISTPQYRLIKNHIPGPFTFILPASKEVPKILKSKKDTIGLRVPDHHITHAIAAALGNPILSSSLPGEMVEANYIGGRIQLWRPILIALILVLCIEQALARHFGAKRSTVSA